MFKNALQRISFGIAHQKPSVVLGTMKVTPFISKVFQNIYRRNHFHSVIKQLNAGSTGKETNTTDDNFELSLSEQEKPIHELFLIVQKSIPMAYRIYDNVIPFTTLLAQIEMLCTMLSSLKNHQDTFLGDPIDEIILSARELHVSILCRRASAAMVLWKRSSSENERKQYEDMMKSDYEKASEMEPESDEVNFAQATYSRVVLGDLEKSLHFLTKSIEINSSIPIKFLKRAELYLEIFDALKMDGQEMNLEQTTPENRHLYAEQEGSSLVIPINSEWSDDALNIMNNCLLDCERYIEDSIQEAKTHGKKDFIMDYYVYNVRGRVYLEFYLSGMNLSEVFLQNAERDLTLFVEHFDTKENEILLSHDSLAEGYVRRSVCRMHSKNTEGASKDLERAQAILDGAPSGDHSDMINYMHELKTQIELIDHTQAIHQEAIDLGAKAAEKKNKDIFKAFEYINRAIEVAKEAPLPMLYIQRAFMNYDMFSQRVKAGSPVDDEISRKIMEKVAADCQTAIELDPSSKTAEARIVLAEYYSKLTAEKQKAIEQYESVLKFYMQENDSNMIKTIETTLETLRNDLSK